MAEITYAEAPRTHRDLLRWLRRKPSYSFADFVQAYCDDPDDRARCEHALQRFEAKNGRVIEMYLSPPFHAGVAVTVKPPPWLFRLVGSGETLWLHRKTEELGAYEPAFGRLLLHVDRQAIRVSNVLAGMSQRIAMSNLFALTRDLVAFLESRVSGDSRDVAESAEALRTYARELKDVEGYSDQAASRQAQIVYLKGMMSGLFVLFLLAPALAYLFHHTDVPGLDTTLFVGCLIAGSFGSIMSVLMRMNAGKFGVTHEIGREYLRNLGFARPFIGAIFALVLYFAFQGELLKQIKIPETASGAFAFFIVSGFLIGFSERLAKEMLSSVSTTFQPGSGDDGRQEEVATPRKPSAPTRSSRARRSSG